MITRRCSERRFFLRPDKETTAAFFYCLAFAADKTDVQIIFTFAASNHHHTGIIDTKGRLPEFIHLFHLLLAKHQNALRGRWESMWAASEQTSVVELCAPEDILNKMTYALTNPVKDFLVEKAHHWPGASSRSANLSGNPIDQARPTALFRSDGDMPASMSIQFVRPPGYEAMSQDEFATLLQSRIAKVEADTLATRLQEGRSLLGRKTILNQHWNDCPGSHEPRREMSPRVAAGNKWRRIETLQRKQAWLSAYQAARQLWLAGVDAIFPAGTWWLARWAAVQVAPA
jgi:hypothetical protein